MSLKLEDRQRQTYVKYMQKFIKTLYGTLNERDLTLESFSESMDRAYNKIASVEHTVLYKEEFIAMEKLINRVINIDASMVDDFDNLKDELLYELNQIEKLKTSKKYKKDKHKKSTWE
jgi:ACT domain-containing protein